MTKPKIRPGQEWEKAHNDGPSSKPTRIRVLEVNGSMRQYLVVGTVTPDGRVIRRRPLLAYALSNTPSGYVLVKDAPPEAKADGCETCGGVLAHTPACAVGRERFEARTSHPGVWEATQTFVPSPLDVVRAQVLAWMTDAEGNSREEADALLSRLEASMRADEREACAKVADEVASSYDGSPHESGEYYAAARVAEEIRARKG